MAHILVVDDDPEIRDFCAVALRDAGHHVVLADNGQSALDIHRIKPQDVVLLDMFMPIKDGLETLTALRQARPAPKIIAVSAGWRVTGRRVANEGAPRDVLDEARALGADVVLRKPFDPEDLLRAVESLLG
jgi:two-component system, chemotaxis family, chemotaxis protein CheY